MDQSVTMCTTTSTANTTKGVNHDQLHETIMLSAKHIIESQETMLRRIEASVLASIEANNARIEASSAGIEALLCKVVESQADKMLEMLKILVANNGANDAAISSEAVVKSSVFTPTEQTPRILIVDADEEEVNKIVEDKLSESNKQQEDDQVSLFNFDGYEPLIEALKAQNWKKAKKYVNDYQTANSIKEIFETRDSRREINFIFRQAVVADVHQLKFLVEIVKLASPEAFEFVHPDGSTILHMAAASGNIKVVKALVEKNSKLTQIRSSIEPYFVPVLSSALNVSDGQKEVLEYLCAATRDEFDGHSSPFSGQSGAKLVLGLIEADMYGLALSVCRRFPELIKEWISHTGDAIEAEMASPHKCGIGGVKQKLFERSESTREDDENPPHIPNVPSTSTKRFITKYISVYFTRYLKRVPCVRQLHNQKSMHKQVISLVKHLLAHLDEATDEVKIKDLFLKSNILEMAIKFGSTEFVLECLQVFPFLCLDYGVGKVGHALMNLVVRERNEMIFNFICTLKQQRNHLHRISVLDENNNSILHVTAELAHNGQLNSVSCAVFQMQREIQWFKGVANIILQKERFVRNNDGDTAQFLFTKNHNDLMEKGEKWMKETSGSCMVVAALIATVAFAAIFTVPGGDYSDSNNHKNGTPVFLHKKPFMVFMVADALALYSSITSVFMFLAVFTSRYSEEDFLKSLPQKLIIGLATLFLSMATILIAFRGAFTIALAERSMWAPTTLALFGTVPVLLFGFLQFPLFLQMVGSTYWPIILGKQAHLGHEKFIDNEKVD